jgi:hypothetical protein
MIAANEEASGPGNRTLAGSEFPAYMGALERDPGL